MTSPAPFHLPDALPAGRFDSWGGTPVWVSDEPPPDAADLWRALDGQRAATGLTPLLCRPDSLGGRALALAEVDAVPLEARLATDFAQYRGERLPWWTGPVELGLPEDVEPFPHDPGPPFESWPGLAPPSPPVPGATGIAPLLDAWPELRACRLVLVPADRAADLPALLGWRARAPLPLLCALLRSWEERFGARLAAVCGSSLHLVVAAPPREAAQAERLALEHVLSTATSVVDDPPTPFPAYAAGLPGRTDWWLWWD